MQISHSLPLSLSVAQSLHYIIVHYQSVIWQPHWTETGGQSVQVDCTVQTATGERGAVEEDSADSSNNNNNSNENSNNSKQNGNNNSSCAFTVVPFGASSVGRE